MCKELLITGKCFVDRREAEDTAEFNAIKNGVLNYEELIRFAENIDADLQPLYESSLLPYSPDHKKIQKLMVEILEDYYGI